MALESLHGVERYQHKWNGVEEEATIPEVGNFTNQFQLMMPPLPKVGDEAFTNTPEIDTPRMG